MKRVVLWASPGLRMASLIPDGEVPRHASGATIDQAWARLSRSTPPGAKSLEVLEAVMQAAVQRCRYASVVLAADGRWTAYASAGAPPQENTGLHPEKALGDLVAQVEVPAPVERAPVQRVVPTKQRRASQAVLS